MSLLHQAASISASGLKDGLREFFAPLVSAANWISSFARVPGILLSLKADSGRLQGYVDRQSGDLSAHLAKTQELLVFVENLQASFERRISLLEEANAVLLKSVKDFEASQRSQGELLSSVAACLRQRDEGLAGQPEHPTVGAALQDPLVIAWHDLEDSISSRRRWVQGQQRFMRERLKRYGVKMPEHHFDSLNVAVVVADLNEASEKSQEEKHGPLELFRGQLYSAMSQRYSAMSQRPYSVAVQRAQFSNLVRQLIEMFSVKK